MNKVIVLGAGRVGKGIVRDLMDSRELEVTIADRSTNYLDKVSGQASCNKLCEDLANPDTLQKIVSGFDMAIGALPGAMGYEAMAAVIEAGVPYVDISFTPEDPRQLDEAAKKAGVAVVYDLGVSPGMSNILATYGAAQISPARHVSILCGALPSVRKQPWEYFAPYSPADIIEEYTRPARIVINGAPISRPALSGLEQIDFPEIGTLEAFHTDGLRSLVDTLDCPMMEEKTLRYPGHADRIRLLRDAGFLNTNPIELPNGTVVSPRELTLKLLEEPWRLEDGEEEFTVMRITIVGGKDAPYSRITWSLLDRTSRGKRETSIARTTGFPASIVARAMLDGTFKLEPGVHPPETIAKDEKWVNHLLNELNSRGVSYNRRDDGPRR